MLVDRDAEPDEAKNIMTKASLAIAGIVSLKQNTYKRYIVSGHVL